MLQSSYRNKSRSFLRTKTSFPFLLESTATQKRDSTCLILFTHAIITSTARASSVFLSCYKNTGLNQSVCVFALVYYYYYIFTACMYCSISFWRQSIWTQLKQLYVESIKQFSNESCKLQIRQSFSLLVAWSISDSFNQSITSSINQSINQSTNQPCQYFNLLNETVSL